MGLQSRFETRIESELDFYSMEIFWFDAKWAQTAVRIQFYVSSFIDNTVDVMSSMHSTVDEKNHKYLFTCYGWLSLAIWTSFVIYSYVPSFYFVERYLLGQNTTCEFSG